MINRHSSSGKYNSKDINDNKSQLYVKSTAKEIIDIRLPIY